MLNVNFRLHSKAGWVCSGCDREKVSKLERSFKEALKQQGDLGELSLQ